MRIRMVVSAALALPLAAQRVQSPDAPWRTLRTPHYRIHFPAGGDFPAFAAEVASRIEGIHAQYLGLIGSVHDGVIDVLIQDPVLAANGMAFPYPNRPFVILWKTPPEADSPIAHHRGWAELLLTHELGHMHHLLWPARRPELADRFVFTPGRLARRAPRWVSEGYATVIEGRLTGSGRPHGAFRAAVLRTWALEGRLPTYDRLNGTQGFLGGNMAYLVGSAYLEWLEAQHPDQPRLLQSLWQRLAGPRKPRFEEAFQATFGYPAEEGYRRFCAEVTHGALEVERKLKAEGLREGTVFTKVDGWISDLAVSPDGTQLMARVLDPAGPEVRIWKLGAPEPARKADPGEPEAAAPRTPHRAPARRLGPIDGALPWHPAWTQDGQGLAFTLRLPDAEGVLAPQAWQWHPGRGATRGDAPRAPLALGFGWDADPAVWNLTRGGEASRTWLTRTLTAAWAPAPTPDGKQVYFARLTATGVEIRKLDLQDGAPLQPVPLAAEALPYAPGAPLSRPDAPSPLPPPVTPPPAHPYAPGETMKTLFLLGEQLTPGDNGVQGGLGVNDLLGRVNAQILGAAGRKGDLRGVTAGATWRGWPVAIGLQAFQADHQPEAQTSESLPGFDRTRRGAEAFASFTRQGLDTIGATLRAGQERQAFDGGPTLTRQIVDLGLDLRSRRSRGAWGMAAGLDAHLLQGRTGGAGWHGTRALADLTGETPWVDLAARFESGRLGGTLTPADRFSLGGPEHTLLPEGLQANQVRQLALPFHLALGDRFERWRGELRPGFGAFYVEHLAVWDAAGPRPPHLRVAGWELRSGDFTLPMDIVQRLLGHFSFSLGVHRILDGPTKDRTVGTLGFTFRP